jgi:hypothetical protein
VRSAPQNTVKHALRKVVDFATFSFCSTSFARDTVIGAERYIGARHVVL